MHPPSLPTSVLLNRRQLGALALLAPWGAQAQALAYPVRPVKLINAFPPGGPSDILARSVGEVLQGGCSSSLLWWTTAPERAATWARTWWPKARPMGTRC